MAKFESDRQTRSGKYQYLLLEVTCSHDVLGRFDNSQSISGHLDPFHYDEKYFDLEDRLKIRTRELMDGYLTTNQMEIIHLMYEGHTQQEVAKILGRNQSSINKSLNGNQSYNVGKNKNINKVYGGSVNKLKRIFMEDAEIISILEEMRECVYDRF